ncbi:MAG: tRNA uridine-5-carboxymethylaminomethyl(34) synthesis GTPase MnmE [Alphaproteobacteria bacterium]|nr:tRNA uridine-5-carboxymethylaminomethyl(34) synthesis GTPase MnmE [Alphaproteobacteria bacterium]
MNATIFAPATALGKAGVAIVRVSGLQALQAVHLMTPIQNPVPRKATLTEIRTLDGVQIDEALVLYFPAPNSFTGEDVVEFQTHGGRAITAILLAELAKIEGFRPADRGEFTRRAVENGKMDLTAAEGLADLVDAETEQQRRQALRQMNGALAKIYERWHGELMHVLAWMEAYIDFPEEEIPESVSAEVRGKITSLKEEIEKHLNDGRRGERLRDGLQIAIIGAPNAGKSSLMNRLAQRDVAIVSSTAGTTRDVIEVRLDINGYPVIVADTAGLRDTAEEIEAEGVRRAKARAEEADLVLWLTDANETKDETEIKGLDPEKIISIMNKADQVSAQNDGNFWISAKTGQGLDALLTKIGKYVEEKLSMREEPSLTRLRHRKALEECVGFLNSSLNAPEIELMTEDLRMAMRSLGKITGQVQVEELLDVIFKDFCIGK